MVTMDYHQYLNLLPIVKQTPESAVWMTLDKEADVLYINFHKDLKATDSELTDDDIIIRYAENDIIGFTVLHASKR
jgi:uncharacterized protein YuzE